MLDNHDDRRSLMSTLGRVQQLAVVTVARVLDPGVISTIKA